MAARTFRYEDRRPLVARMAGDDRHEPSADAAAIRTGQPAQVRLGDPCPDGLRRIPGQARYQGQHRVRLSGQVSGDIHGR